MRFRFISSGRVYPDLGITAETGQVYELDKDPGDGCWQALDEPPAPKKTTKQAAPAADAKE